MLPKLPKQIKLPETFFLMIALPLGWLLSLLIPPGAGFDETTHIARIWEISGFELIPNQSTGSGVYLPSAFAEVSYRSQFFYKPVDYLGDYWAKHINWDVQVHEHTRSVYFPAPYLPLAAAMGALGRILDAPVLLIYYALRLVQLGIYVALTFWAIRLTPVGKWIFTCLALAPMALFQAATVSMDAYTNGISFFFIAWVFTLHLQKSQLSWRQIALTLVVVSLLLAAKPGTFFLLLLLLLLPTKRFPSRRGALVFALSVLALFLTLVVGWNLLVYQGFYLNMPGYGAMGQLQLILAQPLRFLSVVLGDVAQRWVEYLQGWVGVHAYGVGRVPPLVYWLFGAALLGACFLDSAKSRFGSQTRFILLATFFAGYITTVLLLYLTANRIGVAFIQGVQGRYFIPVFPLLFLALLPQLPELKRKLAKPSDQVIKVTLATLTASLLVYAAGIYFSFHTLCGVHYYTVGLCYQPQYRNWAPELQQSSPLTAGTDMQQSFVAACVPLSSVRVWTVLGDRPRGSTLLELQDSTGNIVASSQIENASAVQQGWWEVEFPPIEATVTDRYTIELSSELSDPAEALRFGVTDRREYTLGQFSINGESATYDLIFQYGCYQP